MLEKLINNGYILDKLGDMARKYEPEATFMFVGGCVRDSFLGREVHDWDVVTNADPETLHKMGLECVGQSFPVYQYMDAVIGRIEIACCRRETKIGIGHNGFQTEVVKSFEEDLVRRDLTINAMAWNLDRGLVSNHEHGYSDLSNKILRATSEAFAEDPLRVFRVARFAAQFGDNWVVEESTMKMMNMLKSETETLSVERVRVELEKALMSPKPSMFFKVLRDCDCLSFWFPEVAVMTGVDHNIKWHPERDVFNHQMMVLDRGRELGFSLEEMYCALGHDFGKPLVPKETWPKMVGHEMLGRTPIKDFCKRLGLGHQIENAMLVTAELHTQVHTAFTLRPVTMVRMLSRAKRTVVGVVGFARVCMADSQGRGEPFTNRPYPQADFVINCFEIMKSVKFDGVPNMTAQKAETMYVKALSPFMSEQKKLHPDMKH